MKLSNPFPQEVRLLFFDVYWCFLCGRSDRGLELHHIWGRISGSALNACPLCKDCHDSILHNQETHIKLFKITMKYLVTIKYKLVANDFLFLEKINNDLRAIRPSDIIRL